ncbi:MAG: BatA domain-containing protein, partial [Bythopirellula sp.]
MTPNHLSLLAAFEFASLPMLGWLAAAAIPWLIHRWQRGQHQTTSWAAVELLLAAMQRRARRVRLQQWLLLATRTAILALVALAAAEPALRYLAVGASSNGRAHRILVVDQSYSMGCEQQGSSRFQRALAHARGWVESRSGDALTLVGWSGRAENILGRPTFDSAMVMSALSELQLTDARAELPAALTGILAAIDRATAQFPDLTSHQVVFCTDFGRDTWTVDERAQELMQAISKRAEVTLVNVADRRCNNRAITQLTVDPAITLLQREATINATIACFGECPSGEVQVELRVNGRLADRQQARLSETGETVVRFRHKFVEAGPSTVQVAFTGKEDCLSVDNQRWLVVEVRPKLRVACFAGEHAAADDIVRALAPGDQAIDNAILPESFPISRLADLDLADYAAVMVGSLPELSPREEAILVEYVRLGGGLALLLGESASMETVGRLEAMLPVRSVGIQPIGEYSFDPREYRHPIVAPFRGQAQSGLLAVSVSQYQRLELSSGRSAAEVVLQFDTGDPALVVDGFGLGRVAVSALPCSLEARNAVGAPWSSFALSPAFLPVIRELINYLVGDGWIQQRNLTVGDFALFPSSNVASGVEVHLPNGDRQTLPRPGVEDLRQIQFGNTDERGVY